ncbi:MAG: SDR family oxidoreductase [Bacteroidetes bacterium]|nr:SDR family oxidoreductase [Bacteroidota bacterium]
MKKKILITGSNGLLGQKLLEQLASHAQFDLIATAQGMNRSKLKEGYIFEVLDIANAKQVQEVVSKHQPHYIINTAAMTNVDACEYEKELCLIANVNAVKFLVDAANIVGAHFIHLSTDFVFDGVGKGMYDEEATPNPVSFYADSKLMGEQVVQTFAKKWSIARTIIVYGVVSDMSRSNVILWVKKNLEEGKQINVVDDQFRTPTLADDLARGCILIAEKEAQGIFNISGKDFMNIYELALKVAAFWNLNANLVSASKSETLNQPAKRPPVTGLDISKAQKILGYAPHSFEEGLQEVERQLKRFS